MDLVALVIADDYLVAASSNLIEEFDHELDKLFDKIDDDDDEGDYDNHTIYDLSDVPEDVANALLVQGTEAQIYSDGYDAWEVAQKYVKPFESEHNLSW